MKSMSLVKRSAIIAFALFSFVVLSSCKKTETPAPSTTPGAGQVVIQNFAFNPGSITVNAGTTVTWTNMDNVTHTVTSTTDVFNSGNLAPGKSFSFKFGAAGTYNYTCTIHTYMAGVVIVQ